MSEQQIVDRGYGTSAAWNPYGMSFAWNPQLAPVPAINMLPLIDNFDFENLNDHLTKTSSSVKFGSEELNTFFRDACLEFFSGEHLMGWSNHLDNGIVLKRNYTRHNETYEIIACISDIIGVYPGQGYVPNMLLKRRNNNQEWKIISVQDPEESKDGEESKD